MFCAQELNIKSRGGAKMKQQEWKKRNESIEE